MKKAEFYLKHCLIEASAGTGKTWTIIDIVHKLIQNHAIPLEKILIVTFTEKAAGEIKNRIYELLKKAASTQDNANIKESLRNFVHAPVYTIHAFCQILLKEFSFETQIPFSNQLSNETHIADELFDRVFLDTIRKLNQFPLNKIHFSLGDFLLKFCNFPKITYGGELQIREKVIHAIREIYNHQDLTILPQLQDLHKTSLEWELLYLENFPPNQLDDFKIQFEAWQKKKIANPCFEILQSLILGFEVELVKNLYQQIQAYKSEQSLISYSDMTHLVYKAAMNKPAFVKAVSEKYSWAIVDEFQDTDLEQWNTLKKFFLNSKNRLILVGDPKQAIYGFRGADVYAYLQAKNSLSQMAAKNLAHIIPLDTNYRSQANLVQHFNDLFGHKLWFNEIKSIVQYANIHAAPVASLKIGCDKLPDHRAALNLIKLADTKDKQNISVIKDRLYNFITLEIKNLLKADLKLITQTGIRSIDYNDIAILVLNKNEALSIKKHLDAKNIPARFYKEQGLYKKVQAHEILIMLEAIMQPLSQSLRNKLAFSAWQHLLSSKELINLTNLLWKCNALAARQKWSVMFATLSRFRQRSPNITMVPYETMIYTQIENEILEKCILNRWQLEQIIVYLKEKISQEDTIKEEESIIQSEAGSKINIMTIHASKGLEYPIVFLAGGLTQKNSASDAFYRFHKLKNGQNSIHLDFAKNLEHKNLLQAEVHEEQKRLLYVACTRAGIMLYLPFYKSTHQKGPSGGFLYDVLSAMTNDSGEFNVLEFNTHLQNHLNGKVNQDPKDQSPLPDQSGSPDGPLMEYFQWPELDFRMISLASFSSLHARHMKVAEQIEYEHSEFQNANNNANSSSTSWMETHFRGMQAGNILHEILELLDYNSVFKNHSRYCFQNFSKFNQSVILSALKNNPLNTIPDIIPGKPELDALSRILFNTLCHPIQNYSKSGKAIVLSELPQKDRIHEMDFVYKPNSNVPNDNEYLNGSIDLVFLFDNKYYIADWKSNFHPQGYNQKQIQELMDTNHYHLQYMIYAQSLDRYLRCYKKNYSYDDFGGIFYLFIRGIGMDLNDPDAGIFFTRPSEAAILKFRTGDGHD